MEVYVIVNVHETLTYVASIDSRAIESATRLLADITASNIKLVYIGRGVKRPRNTNPKAEIKNCITFRRYLQTKLQFSCGRYNPHTNTWSPIVAMTSRRSGVALP
ncbi:uncharacterized protein [Eurosta solidaginis]|uniref:uncharacterized protein isoform X1 n=1 Tax=Eurosta solidaginis TaxID=178769 RepID=UPI0035307F95